MSMDVFGNFCAKKKLEIDEIRRISCRYHVCNCGTEYRKADGEQLACKEIMQSLTWLMYGLQCFLFLWKRNRRERWKHDIQ